TVGDRSASSTDVRAARARAAASRSAPAARATTTAPRTGVPAAKEESGRGPRSCTRGRARSAPVFLAPLLLPGRLLAARERRGGRGGGAVRVGGAGRARRLGALRRPAARAVVRRRPLGTARRTRGRATRAGRPAARAGRGDLCGGAFRQGGRRAVAADDRAAAAGRRGGGVRRGRLEGRGGWPPPRPGRTAPVSLA